MSDDIVTRLREGCSACGLHTLYACTDEAADEIERLRAERNRWAHEAEYWHAVADRCDTGCNCLQKAGK